MDSTPVGEGSQTKGNCAKAINPGKSLLKTDDARTDAKICEYVGWSIGKRGCSNEASPFYPTIEETGNQSFDGRGRLAVAPAEAIDISRYRLSRF
jgi:hypothetical protein